MYKTPLVIQHQRSLFVVTSCFTACLKHPTLTRGGYMTHWQGYDFYGCTPGCQSRQTYFPKHTTCCSGRDLHPTISCAQNGREMAPTALLLCQAVTPFTHGALLLIHASGFEPDLWRHTRSASPRCSHHLRMKGQERRDCPAFILP